MAKKQHIEAPVKMSPTGYRAAVGVALFLLVAGGGGYRWLASRYARASESIPIPPGTLARLPLTIGDWKGEDVPMDERIVEATDTDDHVNRTYHRAGGREVVGLWLAYGVRFRDLMPHRPEVCYPGAGWTLQDTEELTLEAADGSRFACRQLRFARGILRNEGVVVLNYYLVDGEYGADVSAIRERVWRFNSGLQYVAQVQVTADVGPLRRSGEAAVRAFAADSAAEIRDLLGAAVAAAHTGTVGSAE